MEYYRNKESQIYADIAYRLGKVLVQYENMHLSGDKFEVTLCLSILQTLLTNCQEHIRSMKKSTKAGSCFAKILDSNIWGVDEKCWVKNTFKEVHNLENFISKIRNSLSHPTNVDTESEFPSTGYSTIKDGSGVIKSIRFINSPDVAKNRCKEFSQDGVISYLNRFKDFPDGVSYEKVITGRNEKYSLFLESKHFARISIIELSVDQLMFFVKNLTNYLAQPIQENWDGKTINKLLLA